MLYSHISFYLIDDIYSDNCTILTSSKSSYDVDKWMKVVQSIARGNKMICQTGLVHQPVCRIIIFTTMTCIVLFLRSFQSSTSTFNELFSTHEWFVRFFNIIFWIQYLPICAFRQRVRVNFEMNIHQFKDIHFMYVLKNLSIQK